MCIDAFWGDHRLCEKKQLTDEPVIWYHRIVRQMPSVCLGVLLPVGQQKGFSA